MSRLKKVDVKKSAAAGCSSRRAPPLPLRSPMFQCAPHEVWDCGTKRGARGPRLVQTHPKEQRNRYGRGHGDTSVVRNRGCTYLYLPDWAGRSCGFARRKASVHGRSKAVAGYVSATSQLRYGSSCNSGLTLTHGDIRSDTRNISTPMRSMAS